MIPYRLLLACLLLMLGACRFSVNTAPPLAPLVAGTNAQNKEAHDAAKAIVERIDRGEYQRVYDESSTMMHEMVGQGAYGMLMSNVRGKLGKPTSRNGVRIGFAKQIDPGGPIGEYAVVLVDTDFSGNTVTEKVVLVREAGAWKLAGYFMSSKLGFGSKSSG